MRVLVACEFSGVVRDQFLLRGHYACSCDLLPSESELNQFLSRPENHHYQGDVKDIIGDGWDMMIAHPPCTYLCVSGNRWKVNGERAKEEESALEFVRFLLEARVEKIALENPIGIISSRIRKPDQIIEPWMFGHGQVKATCLWLKNLDCLEPTAIVEGREPIVHFQGPSEDRWKKRSRTLTGIASAMADQWTKEREQLATRFFV